ncbi:MULTISPECIES: ATP-binding protein [Streptomyces]|uniref:ATP-binding protein n=1 Tax=Streptomyces changanensis TaxID=2964669 RepID=A0ABY5N3V2_9ACTN|nr:MULTISPECIES: ATP-binding protein [Streptomyces]UUS30099.1 ATP-binding protein [Streptomyces changanensis]
MLVLDSRTADSGEVRDVVTGFVADRCPWADLAAVRLVVTELLANALRHTDGRWRLRLLVQGRRLTLELDDASPVPPEVRRPDFGGGGGFGWPLVLRLVDEVDVRPGPTGKTVRAVWWEPDADRPEERSDGRARGATDGRGGGSAGTEAPYLSRRSASARASGSSSGTADD